MHARGLYNVPVRLETSNHFYFACCLWLALPAAVTGSRSCSRPGLVASGSSRRLVVARIARESYGIRDILSNINFALFFRSLARDYPGNYIID